MTPGPTSDGSAALCSDERAPVLLLFLDGVGIGPRDGEINPFFRARLPTVLGALGGALPSLANPAPEGPGGRAFPLDACLDVKGTPQSGTGQVALLTGRNAPALLGRHFGPWPPVRLRPLLEEASMLRRAVGRGARVVFANAYPRGYPERVSPRRVAAPTVAARGAGLPIPDLEALAAGSAVAGDLVNDAWRVGPARTRIPPVTPERAGENLAAIAGAADLTLFAHYRTDFVGHRGGLAGAVAALEALDRFLSGILRAAPPRLSVLIVSDHGNIEDVRGGHTRNPALGMILGSADLPWDPPRRLTDVADYVLSRLPVRQLVTGTPMTG